MLLSLILGLAILSLLFELYISVQRGYHAQAALNQIQFNARSIIHALRASVHKAGYIGCPRLTPDFSVISNADYSLTSQNKIQADSNGPLIVRHAAMSHATLLEPMYRGSLILCDQHEHFRKGDVLIISDCSHAEIFQVKHIHYSSGKQSIQPVSRLHHQYDSNSEVAHFLEYEYSIEPSTIKNREGTHSNRLVLRDGKNPTAVLAEGVESMQIDVTLNQDGVYLEVPADAVSDWSKAVGISIALLFSVPPYKKQWYFYAALQ